MADGDDSLNGGCRQLSYNQITGTLPFWRELVSLQYASFEGKSNLLCGKLPDPRPLNYTIDLYLQVFECSTLPPGYENSGASCNQYFGICASPTSSISWSRTQSITPSLTASSTRSRTPSLTDSSTQSGTISRTSSSSQTSSASETATPSPTGSPTTEATHNSFSSVTLVVIVILAITLFCLIACVVVLLWRQSLKSSPDGYEPFLSLTLPELEDVSAFLSNPDVPLIPSGELEAGRSIGKGASGIVRCGIWHAL